MLDYVIEMFYPEIQQNHPDRVERNVAFFREVRGLLEKVRMYLLSVILISTCLVFAISHKTPLKVGMSYIPRGGSKHIDRPRNMYVCKTTVY